MAHINEKLDFTVSAMIVAPTKKVLLHYHKRLYKWMQLGGHIDLGEDPIEALKRELDEEAGLNYGDLKIIDFSHPSRPEHHYKHPSKRSLPIPFDINRHEIIPGHDHVDLMYLLLAPEEIKLRPKRGESLRLGWFDETEINHLEMYEIIRDLAKAALKTASGAQSKK